MTRRRRPRGELADDVTDVSPGELCRELVTEAGAPLRELVDEIHQELAEGRPEPARSDPSRSMLAAAFGLGALMLGQEIDE